MPALQSSNALFCKGCKHDSFSILHPVVLPCESQLASSPSFSLPSKGLNLCHLNVQHITNKIDQIRLYLEKDIKIIDVLCLTETFFSQKDAKSKFSMKGYKTERKDRHDKCGGGILFYINKEHKYVRRNDLECEDLEVMWIELKVGNRRPLLISTVYRPPSAKSVWFDSFEKMIEKVYMSDMDFYILGDFNINLMGQIPAQWQHIIDSVGLEQLASEPTRVTSKTSTLIDHIYTNANKSKLSVTVPKINLSDHFPICLDIKRLKSVKKKTHYTIKYRDMKNFNQLNCIQDL